MAKTFVEISLATKLRILFGAAVLLIIASALVVPWYFMELLAAQGIQKPGAELTRLRLNEFVRDHPKGSGNASEVSALYTAGRDVGTRTGPILVKLSADMKPSSPLDTSARRALRVFLRQGDQDVAVLKSEDEQGKTVYRCLRAVRVDQTCMTCHGPEADVQLQFQLGRLAGMIDVSMPGSTASGGLMLFTRIAFVVGGVLASLLALLLFSVISQRLILRPLRHLRNVSDKVAEGDLTVRSAVRTGDELQRLGESVNEMLTAIDDQHNKLRSANRALDLKLNELAEVNVTLFRANKVKSEFLANVSHELRTPLNSILGFADLLAEHGDERVKRYGHNVSTAAKNLLAMINDLLDLAKIEAGKADVRFDKVSVTDTCQTLLALMRPLADKKQLTLEGTLAEDLPIVITDAGKLQQILFNLLSNAIKFTPATGRVTLTAQRHSSRREGDEAGEVEVAVADNGPGILEIDQKHIFEKFYQADRTLTKESAGTGLGLAISKELAGLLGGTLTLRSEPGHGTTFSLRIPVGGPRQLS
jgi:two-component system, NarL family, sensor histidine kinase BarA